MKRTTVSLFLCVLLFSALCPGAFAAVGETATLPHVTDAADILSESETETLETLASQASELHSCGIYIIIIDDYSNYTDGSIEDCSEALYNYYKLGYGDERNGIVLLMSMYDRDYDICAYGSLAHASFTDYGKGELAEVFLDNFRRDDWYGGYVDYIRGCDELLKMQEAGQPLDIGSDGETTELGFGPRLAIAVILPCVVALAVCLIFRSQMKSARLKTQANDYVVSNSLTLRTREDIFTHRSEVRELIETNRSHGGTSINSGGFSHHSGKF